MDRRMIVVALATVPVWRKPVIDAVLLPAHAQASPPPEEELPEEEPEEVEPRPAGPPLHEVVDDPEDETEPEDPVEPEEPEEPVDPVDPVVPVKPVDPGKPKKPSTGEDNATSKYEGS